MIRIPLQSTCASFTLIATFSTFIPSVTHAQDGTRYPQRPIRLIIPAAPGGAMDIVGRILAPTLSEELGQQIVVDNRGGAAGNIGLEVAARTMPDGYTVVIGNIGNLALNTSLYPTFPIKPLRDLIPITQTVDTPNTLIVNPVLPARSVKALVDYAKGNPNKLNIGSLSSNRLEVEVFLRSAAITMTRIEYKGGAGPALVALLGNEISSMFTPLSTSLSFINSGRLLALAVVAPKRIASLPDVPTMVQSGFPEMSTGSWQGVLVPRGTPPAVVNRLYSAVVKAMLNPTVKSRLSAGGIEVSVSTSPADFAGFMGRETERWAKVIKDAGITPE